MNWDDLKIFLEVARTKRLSTAAKTLSIDTSTVSRRIHQLEKSLAVRLFERSVEGHYLTDEGQQLFSSTQAMEQNFQASVALMQGLDLEDSGNVRIGTTEAFGSFFVVPQLTEFNKQHPHISIDILPLPRMVKLSRHEADIAVCIGKPRNTSMVVSKLCDYRLKLYASIDYLSKHPVAGIADLSNHTWIGYVDSFDFSQQLSYLSELDPDISPALKSSSVIAQYMAVKSNLGLAILPCFMADKDPQLQCLCDDEIDVIRDFWLMAHPDNKRIKRVQVLWDYMKLMVAEQKSLLMGTKD
ncbi:LysR family transcriptional regulator [Colwelliaceae bacterium BS250]